MKLPSGVYLLWAAIIAVELVLAALHFRRHLARPLPALTLYRYFSPIKRIFLMICFSSGMWVKWWNAHAPDGYPLIPSALIATALDCTKISIGVNLLCCASIGYCLWEVYANTYGHRSFIPDESFRKLVVILFGSMLTIATIAMLARSGVQSPQPPAPAVQWFYNSERFFAAVLGIGFIVLPIRVWVEGYSWRRTVAEMCGAFAFMLNTGLIWSFVMPYLTLPHAVIGQYISMVCVLLADAWWLARAWKPEPSPKPALDRAGIALLRGELDLRARRIEQHEPAL